MPHKALLITLTILLVAMGTRGYSELDSHETFLELKNLLESSDIQVSYQDLVIDDGDVQISDLSLAPNDARTSLSLLIPSLRLEQMNSNQVAIILPDTFTIRNETGIGIGLEVGQGTLGESRRLTLEKDVEGYQFDYAISELEIQSQSESTALLTSIKDIMGRINFEDFVQIMEDGYSSSSTIGELTGRVQFRGGKGFGFRGTNYQSSSTDRGVVSDNHIGLYLPLGEFGFSMETAQFILELENSATIGFLINQLVNKVVTNEDGFVMNSDTLDFIIAYEGVVKEAVSVANSEVDLSLEWPRENEPYHLEKELSLNNIRWDSSYMELLDPEKEFTEVTASLYTKFILTGNEALFSLDDSEEVKPEEIEFTLQGKWDIGVLDLSSEGTGEYTYTRGISTGFSEVMLEGASDFTRRLANAKIIPQPYVAVIMAYLTFHDPESTTGNSLRYKIELKENSEVVVNGIDLGTIIP